MMKGTNKRAKGSHHFIGLEKESDWMSRRVESWTHVLTSLNQHPHQEMVQPIVSHVLAIPFIGVSSRA